MTRLPFRDIGRPLIERLRSVSAQIRAGGKLEPALEHLVALRVSQLNGCGFCVELHHAEAALAGVSDVRLGALVVWRESSRFTPREQAALAWAEAVTTLEGAVPDAEYRAARESFSEEELVELTFAVGITNVWNRLNVAFRTPAEQGREFAEHEHRRRG